MADNVVVTAGAGTTIAADELVDGTLGTVKVQYVKIMDGTIDSSTKATVNSNGLKVDGSAVTQPVSASALPLPSGASTAAKQPALGTAGSAAADVLTVQGITSMTALKVDGSGVTQPVSATSLPLPSGAATVAKQPALGTAGSASADVISVQGVASMTALKVDGSGVTQPVSGTLGITANSSVNVTQFGGNNLVVGNGLAGSGTPRIVIASDNSAFSVNALQLGTWNIAQSGTWTVQPGNTANTTPWLVKPQVATPVLANALSTTPVTVTGSAATLDSYFVYNPNATVAYVQIFDISGTVTLGTSVPKWSVGIPPTSGANLTGINLTFANAIKVAATTTATGSTAPATALDANFGYR